jgi:hypothetical protein
MRYYYIWFILIHHLQCLSSLHKQTCHGKKSDTIWHQTERNWSIKHHWNPSAAVVSPRFSPGIQTDKSWCKWTARSTTSDVMYRFACLQCDMWIQNDTVNYRNIICGYMWLENVGSDVSWWSVAAEIWTIIPWESLFEHSSLNAWSSRTSEVATRRNIADPYRLHSVPRITPSNSVEKLFKFALLSEQIWSWASCRLKIEQPASRSPLSRFTEASREFIRASAEGKDSDSSWAIQSLFELSIHLAKFCWQVCHLC